MPTESTHPEESVFFRSSIQQYTNASMRIKRVRVFIAAVTCGTLAYLITYKTCLFRHTCASKPPEKAYQPFRKVHTEKMKLFRQTPSSVSREKLRCGAQHDKPFCKAFPPLTSSELIHNKLNYNIERVFTFTDNKSRVSQPSFHSTTIPRIIHFMWTNATIPSVFVGNVKSFIAHHPLWDFYFWTYALARLFLREHYPHLLEIFNSYQADVSRSDMLRYTLMHHYGGVYVDLDTHCLRSLETIILKENCVLSPEPKEHAAFVMRLPSLLNDCVLMCRPGHKLFEYLLSRLHLSTNLSFMAAAGPLFFTHEVTSFIINHDTLQLSEEDSFHIVSSELFLDKLKLSVIRRLLYECSMTHDAQEISACEVWKSRGGKNRQLSERAFTVHTFFGTYNKMKTLKFLPRYHFKKVIPGVRTFSSKSEYDDIK